MKIIPTLFILAVLFSACQSPEKLFTSIPKPLHQQNSALNKVEILYTGCGGLLIAANNEAVLTDPYYTGHGLGKHAANPKNTERVLKSIDSIISPKNIKTVLVSHSHYDHMEDLPYLLEKRKLADSVRVLASPSAYCVFRKFDSTAKAVNMDSLKYEQGTIASKPYYWYTVSPNMRILPIEARHAPHFMCIHLMKHCVNCDKFDKRDSATSKMHALHWREGGVYSYLLDVFSSDKKDTLRLFIQTSSCAPPYGFPPQTELALKKVDVAILCAASYRWVSDYPEGILKKLNPKQTILIHWENFFADMYQSELKVVPGTNLKKLLSRMKHFCHQETDEELSKHVKTPIPLQRMELRY